MMGLFTRRRDTRIDSVKQSLPLTDRVLLRQFLDGNETAFAVLVQRHAVLVFGVCHCILRQVQDAEDAFQATFLVLAKRAKSLDAQDSLAGWLHQTARRTSLKLRGGLVRRRILENQALARNGERIEANPASEATLHELAEILDRELALLADRFREVILLCQVEGLTREEVADRLGISVASVKDRLERGRDQLRKGLARRGITVSATTLAVWLVCGTAHAGNLSSLAASTAQIAGPFAAGSMTVGIVPAVATLAEGMLKMMGYEKLRYFTACVISFVAAGGIVFGMLRDEPNRFERGLRGQIVAVSPGRPLTVTISLEEFGTLLNLDVSSLAKVWTAFEQGQLTDLKEGQYVSLRLGNDHRTVSEIHVQGVMREVSITSITADGKLTVSETTDDDDQNGTENLREVELAADAILRIGGLPAKRNELKAGMQVPLEFGRDGKLVHAIEAEAAEQLMISGEILEVNAIDGRIIISREFENDEDRPQRLSLVMTSETLLLLDGQSTTLADVKLGASVRLRLSDDGRSVRAMNVTNPEPEETEATLDDK